MARVMGRMLIGRSRGIFIIGFSFGIVILKVIQVSCSFFFVIIIV